MNPAPHTPNVSLSVDDQKRSPEPEVRWTKYREPPPSSYPEPSHPEIPLLYPPSPPILLPQTPPYPPFISPAGTIFVEVPSSDQDVDRLTEQFRAKLVQAKTSTAGALVPWPPPSHWFRPPVPIPLSFPKKHMMYGPPPNPDPGGGDQLSRRLAGDSYGPVLEPGIVPFKRTSLSIHPILSPSSDDAPCLSWDMLSPPSDIVIRPNADSEVLQSFLNEPATFPRISFLDITSRAFPWVIRVSASRPAAGVTCGDVFNRLYSFFHFPIPPYMAHTVSPEYLDEVYKMRAIRDSTTKGNTRDAIQRIDWLKGKVVFTRLMKDKGFIEDYFPGQFPSLFVLVLVDSKAYELSSHGGKE